jgi:hypothetical protein
MDNRSLRLTVEGQLKKGEELNVCNGVDKLELMRAL